MDRAHKRWRNRCRQGGTDRDAHNRQLVTYGKQQKWKDSFWTVVGPAMMQWFRPIDIRLHWRWQKRRFWDFGSDKEVVCWGSFPGACPKPTAPVYLLLVTQYLHRWIKWKKTFLWLQFRTVTKKKVREVNVTKCGHVQGYLDTQIPEYLIGPVLLWI